MKLWNLKYPVPPLNKLPTHGVIPARIAKTLSFRGAAEKSLLIVTAEDAKIDNKKFRQTFGFKTRMLAPDKVFEQTGHAIRGVCPFGLKNELDIYLDVSMKRFLINLTCMRKHQLCH